MVRFVLGFVFDDAGDKNGEPMADYWLQYDLVERRPLDENVRSMFLKSSSPEEWKKRGNELFERKQFSDAGMCFQRAGDLSYMLSDHGNDGGGGMDEIPALGNRAVIGHGQRIDGVIELRSNGVADARILPYRCPCLLFKRNRYGGL